MKRLASQPRHNWQQRVEDVGFHFHSIDGQPYWDETACYALTQNEVLTLERATAELQARCVEAIELTIRRGQLNRFGIPESFHKYIIDSWERNDPSLYGRFDLAFGGSPANADAYQPTSAKAPKMLEYNADTPTSLLEAAVVQWYWVNDVMPGKDQFNSIHEKLIAAWKWFGDHIGKDLHVAGLGDSIEDFMTMTYLRDTAEQAGIHTHYLDIDGIGWNGVRFVGLTGEPIRNCFKLYPWEWMVRETFAEKLQIDSNTTRWIEPAWKMLLSNKAILPVLWELFPEHPNLLPASFNPLPGESVRKPLLSREGANVTLLKDQRIIMETQGTYGGPYIYQQRAHLACHEGNHAVIGSWVIGGEPAGIGIREDRSPVTGNLSRFVPHYIE